MALDVRFVPVPSLSAFQEGAFPLVSWSRGFDLRWSSALGQDRFVLE